MSIESAENTVSHLTAQLPGERFPLNDQQMAIAQAVVGTGQDATVRAKAGTGKTSTLEALARRFEQEDPSARILYIVFNRSNQVEADGRMPPNVESRTGHSLAWRWAGERFTGKVVAKNGANLPGRAGQEAKYLRSRPGAIAKALGLLSPMRVVEPADLLDDLDEDDEAPRKIRRLGPDAQAEIVIDVVGRYANSGDRRISGRHFVTVEGVDLSEGMDPDDRDLLLDAARDYWSDITRPLGSGCKFRATFDHLRKMWALAGPQLHQDGWGCRPATVVFLDEAQDTPPVLAGVIADQSIQAVVVGDQDQAIYGFAGATDYLQKVDAAVSLPLTRSYRFGSAVAGIANEFLGLLDASDLVTGVGPVEGRVGFVPYPDAVLTRTNLGLLKAVSVQQSYNRKVGVLKQTKDDFSSLVQTARWLFEDCRDDKPEQPHRDLEFFRSWGEFAKKAKEPGRTKTLYKIIAHHGIDGLDEIVRSLRVVGDGVASAHGVDVLITTAHKSKGLEWAKVQIGEDFGLPSPDPLMPGVLKPPSPETLRLSYVAVTRAMQELDLGSLAWIVDPVTRAGLAPLRAA